MSSALCSLSSVLCLFHPKPPAGNTQMAILLGLYDSENYCWRSMTSPGITGLFNPFCLQAGEENLMKCYPGDNTYTLANTSPATVSLINEDNQFHSLTTNTGTNGEALAEVQADAQTRNPAPPSFLLSRRLSFVPLRLTR